MVIDLRSGLRPRALTCPRKAPARSIHSSTEEQHCGFSQTVTHPSTNEANCCLTSKVLTLAFYHSALGKRQNSSGDLRYDKELEDISCKEARDTKDRSITRKRVKEVFKEDNTFKEQVERIQQGFPG